MQHNHFIATSCRHCRLVFLQAHSKCAHKGGLWKNISFPRAAVTMLHAKAWRSTERLSLKSRDDWWPKCTRGSGMLFYLKPHCFPSLQFSIPPIPCLPSFMPSDLLFFLASINLLHNQSLPCAPVLPKSQEQSDTRDALYHRDGKCQVHKINANFMAPLSHSAKFYETEKTWNLMLWGPFGWQGAEQTLSNTVSWQLQC